MPRTLRPARLLYDFLLRYVYVSDSSARVFPARPAPSRTRFPALLAALLGLWLAAGVTGALAQTTHTFRALVQDAHHGEALAGVNVGVEGTTIGAATDAEGRVEITGIPGGAQTLVFSFIGFETARRALTFPLGDPAEVFVIRLEEAHGELDEIAVSATRTSRTIADQATRVETIAGEEIDEKISMDPSNITMLLNESPGITVQQTSAVTGGASIRIQGLDGRYTQLLKDGFPLYGGFSGGLSLLQVPPLDLRQVEVIKGPSSTLYGGDAIAGLVNLVSKTPESEPERSLLVNITSAGGYDVGGFFSGRGERFGYTLLASANLQQAYDPDDDDFSNLAESRRVTVAPRLFAYLAPQTTLSFGVSGSFEEREGGDIDVLSGEANGYTERNESTRVTTQARLDHGLGDVLGRNALLTVKNSTNLFDRRIKIAGYRFEGRQVATYSEVSLLASGATNDLVLGIDARTDAFREDETVAPSPRDYTHAQIGAFVQETWDISPRVILEAGLRADYHDPFGFFLLPKASVLLRATESLSARVGGGLGYKAPTVFLEPSEERAFRGVLPLGDGVEAETSRGGSIDVNYRTRLWDRLGVSINQAVYLTDLDDPLVATTVGLGPFTPAKLVYGNADGSIRTFAQETNAKLTLGDFKLFLGYVHLHTHERFGGEEREVPLTPEHKTYTVLVYEKHGTMRIGLEAYYTSPQPLSDGSRSDGYWVTGLMAERRFGPARLFLNFENFLDTKQTDYAPVVTGPRANPAFAEIWAPMDGFVVNGGVKLSL